MNRLEPYPKTRLVFDRRKESLPTKEGRIEIEISHGTRRKWIATGVKVLPKNWDKKTSNVIGRLDAHRVNKAIETSMRPIVKFIEKLKIDEKPFKWEELDQMLEKKSAGDSFVKFVENYANTRKDIREGTRKNHMKLVHALSEYKKIISFDDLTRYNIIAFDQWLHARREYKQTTIACYHKFMKAYINEALRRELITENPYLGIKIDRGKSALRKYLTDDELEAVETVELKTDSLNKVRDLFVFQCYTGLAYADLSKFDFRKVVCRSGKYILHDTRQKTGEEFYIVLLSKAIDILKKYDYVLPVMTNQQYNLRLKLVSQYAGLDKELTSHMGRHTYATMCLNSGIQIEVLAKMMGHTDIKTTQIYAKMVNTTVEAAYDVLEKSIAGKG